MRGSNQFILLLGGAIAALVGFKEKISFKDMLNKVSENLQAVTGALLILLFVGALAGTWLISGIIPAMIYYGLQILHPSIFLPACIIICAIISLATGSSWTTSATVGIALIGIAKVLGVSEGMAAGAVISGAYFGDKLSPLSDTTNLAPAMAGIDLYSHIRYMTYTTVPTYIVTLIVFILVSFNLQINSVGEMSEINNLSETIINDFYISTKKKPSSLESDDLIFASKICKHTKSNTIVFAKNNTLVSSGTGQTSRVDALKQAIEKAEGFGFSLDGAVMASDAFFPFPDCVELARNAGVLAVVQPGGSIKDQDSIDFCNANDMSMVMTGIRHFKH